MYISRSKHQVPVVYLEAGSTPPAVKDREAPVGQQKNVDGGLALSMPSVRISYSAGIAYKHFVELLLLPSVVRLGRPAA